MKLGNYFNFLDWSHSKYGHLSYTSFHCLKLKINVFFNCSWPGRAHDARVFAQSPVAEDLADLCYIEDRRLDETFHIIGDSAYPLSNYLITPYRVRRQNMTVQQKKFNTHLASKRAVIERAFGLLGLRFPRLMRLKVNNLDKRIKCIVSSCVLHNWCIIEDDGDNFEDIGLQLDLGVGTNITADAYLGRKRATGGGVNKRDLLCQYIATQP